MRDLFLTTRSFVKRLGALLRYQQALKDMNKYPDATAEDLGREDTCIICREEMQPWDTANPGQVERSRPKKLPCGHILHLGCLKSWLERQQVCPTCRRSVVMDPPAQARNRNPLLFRLGLNGNNQNQQPPANGAAPGGVQGGPPAQGGGQNGQNGQPNGRNGGFRLNLGPLRLVVAQGGAQDLEDVAQRFGIPPNDANLAVANTPIQQAGGQDQNTSSSVLLNNIRAQIAQVNQQVINATERVQQDVQGLRDAESQLVNLSMLLQEMTRLNQLQQAPIQPAEQQQQQPQQSNQPEQAGQTQQPQVPEGMTPQQIARIQAVLRQQAQPPPQQPQGLPTPPTVPHNPAEGPPPLTLPLNPEFIARYLPPYQVQPPVQPPFGPYTSRFNTPTFTRHGGASLSTAIPAGSPDLPEGVIIPPGWSLLPLQRLDNRVGGPHPSAPGPSAGPTSAPRTAGRSQSATRPPASERYGDFVLPGGTDGAAIAARVATWDQLRPNSAPIVESSAGLPEASTSVANAGTLAESSTQEETRGREEAGPTTENGDGVGEPEVTAPTPTRLPNWGGSAQLFSAPSREGASDVSKEETREQSPSPQQEDDSGVRTSANPSTSTDKGKGTDNGKAVTVEDGGSDSDDET
jgi:E3 ubiquitin-protein ligase synoviolin